MMGERFNDNERGHVETLAEKLTAEERAEARGLLGPDVFRHAWVYVVEAMGDVAHVFVRRRGGDLVGILEVNNVKE